MGSGDADVAWLATFAYVLAHQKYSVNVGLTTMRNGLDTYKGEIIARADSGINRPQGIATARRSRGRTPPAPPATSIRSALFASQGDQTLAKRLFAGGHPQAVLAVYQGTCRLRWDLLQPRQSGRHSQQMAARSQIKTYPDIVHEGEDCRLHT